MQARTPVCVSMRLRLHWIAKGTSHRTYRTDELVTAQIILEHAFCISHRVRTLIQLAQHA